MSELKSYRVDGMTCEGCARAVTNALRKTRPDAPVEVELALATVRTGGIPDDEVKAAVERAGFTYVGAAG